MRSISPDARFRDGATPIPECEYRWSSPALLAMTENITPRRPLHQQRGDAAGAAAHGEHPRARLAAGAHLGDIDAGGGEPGPRRIGVGDAPAQAPQPVARGIEVLAGPVHDLDDEVAAAKEHQPAPVRMRTVEPHVEPEPRAVQCRRPFGIAGRDHDMVHRGDRGRLGAHRQRALPGQFEEEQPHAARGVGRSPGPLPRQRGAGLGILALGLRDRLGLERQPLQPAMHLVNIIGAEAQAGQPLALLRDDAANPLRGGALAGRAPSVPASCCRA